MMMVWIWYGQNGWMNGMVWYGGRLGMVRKGKSW